MKNRVFFAALAATTFSAALANAAPFYVEGQVGYNSPDADGEDDAAVFGGIIGYHAAPNIRLEGEVTYRKNDFPGSLDLTPVGGIALGGGDLSTTTFMINAYYDFKNSSAFTPFLGGGIGAAYLSNDMSYTDGVNTINSDDSDTSFVYHLAAGGSYALGQNTALTLGYHWIDTSSASLNATINGTATKIDADYRAHELRAGLRYNF